MKKYLMTGGNGKLGSEIRKILDCEVPQKDDLDIMNPEQIEEALNKEKYDGVLHLAAISDAKLANKEKFLSYRINVIGTRNVAMAAKKHSLKIFYISTDYIFEGDKGNYKEEDNTEPANWYGFTKYAGELEIQNAIEDKTEYCIIRTSFRPSDWNNFTSAYSNVYTSADFTDIIAKEICRCIQLGINGIIHIGTPKKSFYDLASQRNPDIKSEVCTDDSFPKNRFLNIDKWIELKNKDYTK